MFNMIVLTDSYAEIILCEHLNKVDDMNLPETVPDEEGNPKMTVSELDIT